MINSNVYLYLELSMISFSEIYHLFTSQILKKKDVDNVTENSKLLILVNISLLFLVVSGTTLVQRFFFNDTFESLVGLTSLLITFIFLFVYIKKTKNIRIASHILNVVLYIFIPIRVYQTGGIYAPVVNTYIFHVFLVTALQGRLNGAITFCWSIVSIITFSLTEVPSELLMEPVGHGFIVLFVLVAVYIPMHLILNEKDELLKKIADYEKSESAKIMMHRLTHEIGNSLSIAMGFLQFVKSKDDVVHCDKAQERLKDIDNLLKGMTKLSDNKILIETLNKLESEIKIMDTLKDDNEG